MVINNVKDLTEDSIIYTCPFFIYYIFIKLRRHSFSISLSRSKWQGNAQIST